ncbi:MAG TPA: DUF5947 family protein [Nocardioidaceae bacterium]|nr:DUF5947 family protein [Nocardioidaceae bacterium]
MTTRAVSAVGTLRRINGSRPRAVPGERCEMCSAPVAEEHQHVVDLSSRSLLCTCRPCYLLFTDQQARLRYRAVPDRYLAFPGFRLPRSDWEDLQIPVGLAFLFENSVQERVVAFYPGPAGATESELPMAAWHHVLETNPGLDTVLPDVEALLVHGREPDDESFTCHVVPIDACYELVGRMRATWRGFDGGQEARAAMAEFFATVDARSTPVAVSR